MPRCLKLPLHVEVLCQLFKPNPIFLCRSVKNGEILKKVLQNMTFFNSGVVTLQSFKGKMGFSAVYVSFYPCSNVL